MRVFVTLLAAGSFAAVVPAAPADVTFIETFSNGSNVGGWSFGRGGIEPAGGNPGACFRTRDLDTFAPQARTTRGVASLFSGDFRAARVTSLGIDLATFYVDFSAAGRPLSLLLVSDNGTPSDVNDDWAAYRIGPVNVPVPGEGWRSFSFDVPSQAAGPGLPEGWRALAFGPSSPPAPSWSTVITDVKQVVFFYGDPEFFFIFQVWDVAMDNPRITRAVTPGDLNGDHCVDQSDLGILLAAYGVSGAGDLDGDKDTDQADLGILLANYGNGC